MDKIMLGTRIKQARALRNYTLDELAQEIGLNKSTLSRYERGEITNPKLPVIESIANALHVNPSWLIGKSDAMTTPIQNSSISIVPQALALDDEEQELIRKYRCLDDRGKAVVNSILNHEYESLPGEKADAAPKEA